MCNCQSFITSDSTWRRSRSSPHIPWRHWRESLREGQLFYDLPPDVRACISFLTHYQSSLPYMIQAACKCPHHRWSYFSETDCNSTTGSNPRLWIPICTSILLLNLQHLPNKCHAGRLPHIIRMYTQASRGTRDRMDTRWRLVGIRKCKIFTATYGTFHIDF